MKGSCLCGGVVFEVSGPLRDVFLCHCTQCRKQSGHVWAASNVPLAAFRLLRDEKLAWFAASALAQRGFCSGCGAFLFWQGTGSETISFAPGALEGATGLTIGHEWHPEDAADYYTTPQEGAEVLEGSCLCGANRFSLPGPMGEVTACHCSQCRKTSGHYSASFDVELGQIRWHSRRLRDHVALGGAIRSFCPTCGSGILFAKNGAVAMEAGVIDTPTGGWLGAHVFAEDKADYYELPSPLTGP